MSDLQRFSQEVVGLARTRARGWQGNRKAYISHAWQSFAEAHPASGLDLARFKAMLSEAHRAGHVSLVTADLREADSLLDIEASAVGYMNTVWHFIRVGDN